MKIKEILEKGNQILKENNVEEFSLKIKMLLSHILNVDKTYLIINSEKEIGQEVEKEFFVRLDRLLNNEPIQYIINKQDFFGLEFYVDNNVLIPQPDTEILVEECINIIKDIEKNPQLRKNQYKILDLCTGSGAIGISLAKKLDNSIVYVSDISEKALEIAEKNAIKNNVKIECIKSDMFKNINEKFDIIVSNPPYIETDTITNLNEEVKKEPILALDGGTDGLYFYRIIAKEAKKYLMPNGYLALEIGYNQKQAVEELLNKNSLKNIYSKKDLGGNNRIVIANII